MKVLYLGDFIKMNGPSIVDINLTNKLNDLIYKVQIDNKYFSNLGKIKNSDIINISGVSAKGVLYSLLGRCLGKKVTYIMHGALRLESNFRKIPFNRKLYEAIILKMSNRVICVSEKFEEIVNKHYPNLNTTYINNGIDINENLIETNVQKNKNTIVTVGGGRPEKGVLNVCKAIELLKNENITLIVAGEDGKNTDEIKSYKFVEYKGFINHDELMRIMEKCNIFIQNSHYEPFGITVIEALANGCNVIISDNIGAPIRGIDDYIVNSEDTNKMSILIDSLYTNKKIQNIDTLLINQLTWDLASQYYKELWFSLIRN